MAKTVKKVSISKLDEIAKESYNPTVTIQWHGTDVTITPTLPLSEMLGFVNDVVESCFSDEGDFLPQVMDFAIDSNILTRYANFSLPNNIEHRYSLIYTTDAVSTVMSHINQAQIENIVTSINRKIKYLCDTNIRYMRAEFEKLLGNIEDVQRQTENLFQGVSADDMRKLVDSLSEDGKMNTDKIVEAYVRQKGESEDFAERPDNIIVMENPTK